MKRAVLTLMCLLLLTSCTTREMVATFAQRLALDAQNYIDSGADDKAIRLLTGALNVDSKDEGILTCLAIAYANTGAVREAIDTLAAALDADNTNLNACIAVSEALLTNGAAPDRVYALWLSANKDDEAAGKLFAQHYIDSGDAAHFESYCRLWMREEPHSYAAAFALADAIALSGDAQGASNIRLSYFKRVAEDSPDDLSAVKALSEYISTTGDSAEAQQVLVEFYKKRLEKTPDDRSSTVALYELYKYQINNDAILKLLDDYLALKPDDNEVRAMLNTTRIAMGMRVIEPGGLPEGAGDIVQVAAGTTVMGYLKRTGELYLWGANYDGEVTGEAAPQYGYEAATTPIKRMDGIAQFALGGTVRPDVYGYTLAVAADGKLYGFGYNVSGILDTPSTQVVLEPRLIAEGMRSISAGFNHAAAVSTDSILYTWGDNTYGQLCDDTQTATAVPKQVMTGVAKAIAGYGFTVILKLDGSLWICGWNAEDAGYGANDSKRLLSPKKLMDGVADIAANRWDVYALDQTGVLWAYRGMPDPQNAEQPDGNGAWLPTARAERFYEGVKQVNAAHGRFALLVTDKNELLVWGANNYACLGLGYGDPRVSDAGEAEHAPVLLLRGVAQASAGAFNGIALMSDGSMMAWGGGDGMIGDGKHDGVNKPTKMNEK